MNRALLVAALLMGSLSGASAHEMRPAYLELKEVAPETYDEVRIEGSPNLRVRAIGGYHGDVATASIVVNSLPKVIGAAPKPSARRPSSASRIGRASSR